MPGEGIPKLGVSLAAQVQDDLRLVQRVMNSYKLAMHAFTPSASRWDTGLLEIKKEVHDALLGASVNEAARVLRDPSANTLFWGFDAIASSPTGEVEPHELVLRRLNGSTDWKILYAMWVRDALISFAEAIGARRFAYPEIEIGMPCEFKYSVDEIIEEIEAKLGLELQFPNPYPNEFGLPSKRGVIGFRSVQSAYQAWRIAQLASGNLDFKVMEIGAGLGRTAYFSKLFGVQDYTIVDIPLTNAAQGYFLGRVLGPDHVHLYGDENSAPLKVIPSSAIESGKTYDLIVNVDSWTEMSPDIAQFYWNYARQTTRMVLSINYEHNPQTVRALYKDDPDVKASRFPYCMRRGYVEEILTWK